MAWWSGTGSYVLASRFGGHGEQQQGQELVDGGHGPSGWTLEFTTGQGLDRGVRSR